MRLSTLIFTTPLFLFACSSAPPSTVAPVEEKPATIVKHEFSKVLGSNFRGQFSFGDEKGYFKACGTNQEFSVNASFVLRNIYEQVSSTPYTPVYIEFTGEVTFPKNKSEKSTPIMRVDRVHHMALAKASLQCDKPIDTFLFKASGDNPYWRLSIDNQQLFFSTKASSQAYDVDDADFRTTQINSISTTNTKGQRLNLKIQPGHCYDLKNKAYWGYTTKVDSIWGEYSGCGEPGWPVEEQLFTGYYLSTNNNLITNLTLNPNYTVEYKETVDGKETIKTGFWKTNSPKRVVVMLDRQADTRLRQELIFNREGLTLSIEEINNNNIVSPFLQVLTFNKMNVKDGIGEVKVNRINRINRINREFSAQLISPDTEIDVDIQKAVNDYFKIHRTDPKETKFSAVKYDLNGDGIDEAIVLLDWCSTKNGCEMLIFEGQKEDYRFSSRVSRIHTPIIISQSQHYLWQSLLFEKNSGWSLLDFDGLSYPSQTRDLTTINKTDYSTDVILFNKGKPTKWFPIKM
jgi:putative lipoprotein